MKTAVVGSRNLTVDNLEDYLPKETREIVSGGAKGIDTCAKEYAQKAGLAYTEFLPEYRIYGKGAPLRRNEKIVQYADFVLIFWDGKSRGTKFVIHLCEQNEKPMKVYADGKLILWQ